jgi:hypothetical protein
MIFFVCIAIILSFVVFCTGALYSAVNSMDFIKKISADLDYMPVRQDFVYVYGGLHTLLILMFYIPVKLKFASYQSIFVNAANEAAEGDSKTGAAKIKKAITTPLNKSIEFLVAGSPILISFLQAVLDYFFAS